MQPTVHYSKPKSPLLHTYPLLSHMNPAQKWILIVLYSVLPLLDAKCNLLGYRRHRSICYTCLFTTPLVVITISLLQWILTLWCTVSERSFDLFSVLYSSERWRLTNWLTLSLFISVSHFSLAPCIRKSRFVGDAKSVPDRWVATFISEVSPNPSQYYTVYT
jgi:hypothetical protein